MQKIKVLGASLAALFLNQFGLIIAGSYLVLLIYLPDLAFQLCKQCSIEMLNIHV